MSVRKVKLAKRRKRLVWRAIVFLSLLISAFCMGMALSGIVHQPAAKTVQVQNTEQNPVSTPISTPETPIADAKSEVAAEAQPVKSFLPPTQYQGKLVKKVQLATKDKVVALTFDDGPSPRNTLKILKILEKNDIKATFFWIGRMLKKYPEIGKEVAEAGHVIANHTWSHSYRQMNKAAAAWEIDDTEDLIYQTTGIKSLYFRPPGGILTNGVADYAKKKNYAIIMWSKDSIDYRRYDAKRLVNNVMRKIKPTEIVLMHDGGGDRSATVKALPEIISRLKKLGYKFVTIPELLAMNVNQQAADNSEDEDSHLSPINNEEKNFNSSSIAPDQEVSPEEGMQAIPDSQIDFSTEQY